MPSLSSPIIADSVDFVCGGEMTLVYKICRAREWQKAAARGTYTGSADDRRDGFIHLSASHQLPETARRHFAGETDLILVAFDAEALHPALRWEPSRGGELFPHLHGSIATQAAKWARPLPWRNGAHDFPPDIAE
jgi:uncharacterized protein (DUF952 family)